MKLTKQIIRKLIKEEYQNLIVENNELIPGTNGTYRLRNIAIDDDIIDDWNKDKTIKKYRKEGRVELDGEDVWIITNDKEVEKYVRDNYEW